MTLKNSINYLFSILGLFSASIIPIYGVGAIYIALWFVVAILYFLTHKSLSRTFITSLWLILPMFYFMHLLGMIYTQNTKSGLFDLEVKLSMFILPIIFYFQHKSLNSNNVKYLKLLYLISIFSITLFLLIKTIIAYDRGSTEKFYYTELATPYHPSYIAVYVVMALIFLFELIINEKRILPRVMYFILKIYFLYFIFILSSKAGILSVPLVLFLAGLHYIFRIRKILVSIIVILLAAVFVYFGVKNNMRFKAVKNTIQTAKTDVTTNESNAVRYLIWQAGIDIVKKNALLGVGTGDIKDVLLTEYAKRNMSGALEKKLNAHNQFLETAIGQGIVGLLVLFLVFFIPFIRAYKNNNIAWMLFLVLSAFNFLFESMLNTQMGVFFFAYFYSFFIFEHKLKKNDSFFTTKN